jgi:hypothetical protein
MRMTRALIAAMAIAAVLPQVGTAQIGHSFKDAWFWGVKAGGMDFNSATAGAHQQAPLLGGEWLITRSRGGLYVSFSQAFLTDQAAIQLDPADTSYKIVDLKNMRRLDAAAMVFPGKALFTRPYAGVGFSLKQINSAMPADLSSYSSPDELATAMSFITQLRTAAAPYFIVGTQIRLPLFSVFFQGTASPANKNMFLYNGKSFHLTYEAGLRYNVGTSIDRN